MKIRIWCGSSTRKDIIDLQENWGMSYEDWNNLPPEEQEDMIREHLTVDIGWQEVE